MEVKKAKQLSFSEKIMNQIGLKNHDINYEKLINSYDRSYGIQKIFDLHMKKDYKVETLFIATGIFDRYI